MSKVDFIYSKGGKRVPMALRYAETLRKLGHGTYQTKVMTAATAGSALEPIASEAIIQFAAEHNVDLLKVVGTGKDGRIKKSDVEAVIADQDLV